MPPPPLSAKQGKICTVPGEPPAGEANDPGAGSAKTLPNATRWFSATCHLVAVQAYAEVNFNLIANFFLTTFPTNMCQSCNSQSDTLCQLMALHSEAEVPCLRGDQQGHDVHEPVAGTEPGARRLLTGCVS